MVMRLPAWSCSIRVQAAGLAGQGVLPSLAMPGPTPRQLTDPHPSHHAEPKALKDLQTHP